MAGISGDKKGNLSVRGWFIVVLVFLATIFVLQNTEVVEITFLFWRLELSRVILLLGAIALGAITGVLVGWELFGKRKKKEPQLPKPPEAA